MGVKIVEVSIILLVTNPQGKNEIILVLAASWERILISLKAKYLSILEFEGLVTNSILTSFIHRHHIGYHDFTEENN